MLLKWIKYSLLLGLVSGVLNSDEIFQSVRIFSPNDEKIALNLLKKEFPRGSKVKIKPIGFKENILIAKVFDINETRILLINFVFDPHFII